MYCQACGVDAPTKYVSFHQNIGILVMRFYEGVEGNLCRSCVNGYFWRYTLVNLTIGWWGLISLIITPFFVLNNIFYYIPTLGMEGVPEGAGPPELTERDIQTLVPFTQRMIDRLNADEPLESVVHDVAMQSNTTPAKVFLYLRTLASSAEQ